MPSAFCCEHVLKVLLSDRHSPFVDPQYEGESTGEGFVGTTDALNFNCLVFILVFGDVMSEAVTSGGTVMNLLLFG